MIHALSAFCVSYGVDRLRSASELEFGRQYANRPLPSRGPVHPIASYLMLAQYPPGVSAVWQLQVPGPPALGHDSRALTAKLTAKLTNNFGRMRTILESQDA